MLKTYEYHRPADLPATLRLLDELADAQVLAGGTDLLFDIASGLRRARHVISLADVDELRQIEEVDDNLAIGAGCTACDIQSSRRVRIMFRVITETASVFASP